MMRIAKIDITVQFAFIEEAILSGQLSEREVQYLMANDPRFAAWLRARAESRRAGRSPGRLRGEAA